MIKLIDMRLVEADTLARATKIGMELGRKVCRFITGSDLLDPNDPFMIIRRAIEWHEDEAAYYREAQSLVAGYNIPLEDRDKMMAREIDDEVRHLRFARRLREEIGERADENPRPDNGFFNRVLKRILR